MLPEGTDALIDRALAEDIGTGDHTTQATIPAIVRGSARLLVKNTGVLAGVEVAQAVVQRYDADLHMRTLIGDGGNVADGDVAFTSDVSSPFVINAVGALVTIWGVSVVFAEGPGYLARRGKMVRFYSGGSVSGVAHRRSEVEPARLHAARPDA